MSMSASDSGSSCGASERRSRTSPVMGCPLTSRMGPMVPSGWPSMTVPSGNCTCSGAQRVLLVCVHSSSDLRSEAKQRGIPQQEDISRQARPRTRSRCKRAPSRAVLQCPRLHTCWPWVGSPSMPGIGAVASVTAAMKLAPDSIACAVCGSCAAGPCARQGGMWCKSLTVR